jgi:hypothetical protein
MGYQPPLTDKRRWWLVDRSKLREDVSPAIDTASRNLKSITDIDFIPAMIPET